MQKRKKVEKLPEIISIGERLRELRKAKGYASYEHISYELKMSRSAYWQLEKGANFEMKTMIRLCKLLNVTLKEFFEGLDIPRPEKKKKK